MPKSLSSFRHSDLRADRLKSHLDKWLPTGYLLRHSANWFFKFLWKIVTPPCGRHSAGCPSEKIWEVTLSGAFQSLGQVTAGHLGKWLDPHLIKYSPWLWIKLIHLSTSQEYYLGRCWQSHSHRWLAGTCPMDWKSPAQVWNIFLAKFLLQHLV